MSNPQLPVSGADGISVRRFRAGIRRRAPGLATRSRHRHRRRRPRRLRGQVHRYAHRAADDPPGRGAAIRTQAQPPIRGRVRDRSRPNRTAPHLLRSDGVCGAARTDPGARGRILRPRGAGRRRPVGPSICRYRADRGRRFPAIGDPDLRALVAHGGGHDQRRRRFDDAAPTGAAQSCRGAAKPVQSAEVESGNEEAPWKGFSCAPRRRH